MTRTASLDYRLVRVNWITERKATTRPWEGISGREKVVAEGRAWQDRNYEIIEGWFKGSSVRSRFVGEKEEVLGL